jgi:hypothetical protein
MKKSLTQTNPYLRKKSLKKEMTNRFLTSSSAIEGIQTKKKKSLIDTNPYLKDPVMREKLVKRSVRTSCAVEGIPARPDDTATIKIIKRTAKRIYKTKKNNLV